MGMKNNQFRNWKEEFDLTLKKVAKNRKIKISNKKGMYKKSGPYFYQASYSVSKNNNDVITIKLDIAIKFHHFDELQLGITRPGTAMRFTDDVRANSALSCHMSTSCMSLEFELDPDKESIIESGIHMLDLFEKSCSDFITGVKQEYGDLGGYYIAKKRSMPKFAGLAYLDKGDIASAAECFSAHNMEGKECVWYVGIKTDEQRRRVQESGAEIYATRYGEVIHRNYKEQFADYAVTLKNGLKWDREKAMYGLLKGERKR